MQTTSNGIKRTRSASSAVTVLRCAVVVSASTAVLVAAGWLLAVAWLSAHRTVAADGPASPDELLTLGCASLAGALAAWLVVGIALEVLAHAPGRIGAAAGAWADRLTPSLGRRIAAFLLGVGMGVVGGPSPATADPGTTGAAGSPTSELLIADPGFGALATAPPAPDFSPAPAQPGFTPTAPRVRPQTDTGLLGGRNGHATSDVVVHRGDSLWSIAASHLGPDASDAEIAHAWPLWFDANRDVIGDDPDLLLPGQILQVPLQPLVESARP